MLNKINSYWMLWTLIFGTSIPWLILFIDVSLWWAALIVVGIVWLVIVGFGVGHWDRGDNQQPGYKDYKTRKEEELGGNKTEKDTAKTSIKENKKSPEIDKDAADE